MALALVAAAHFPVSNFQFPASLTIHIKISFKGIPMGHRELMARVKARHGKAIADACHLSSVPEGFVAALIANESGGDPTVKRFEPGVFKHLLAVHEGKEKRYGAITREHLAGLNDDALRMLATSYGLTQIMGYNAVFRHIDPLTLSDPRTAILLTLRMLAECCEQNGLDPRADFADMLRWWNTGRVDGQTHDPDYVSNAHTRAEAYITTA